MKKIIFIFIISFFAFSCNCQKIEVSTKNNEIKQSSIIYEEGVLKLDHIKSKITGINLPKKMPVKKVIFEFVDLTEATENFWRCFSDTEVFVFSYTTLNNLDFMKYLKNAKAISFKESNYIDNYHINILPDSKLEYLEFQVLSVSDITFSNNVYDKLKYLVIYNAKFNESCYKRIKEYFGKETCYIVNTEQFSFFTNYNYSEPYLILDLWKEFNID